MPNPNSFTPDPDVLAAACKVLSKERALQIREMVKWRAGGCLTQRTPPAGPDASKAEDAHIRAVWDSIPNGSSSWSTALDAVVNYERPETGTQDKE
jgi:hypothetical protein